MSVNVACSLVVDTDECATSADCDFGDGSQLQCVAKECVPFSAVRQALVPDEVTTDMSLSARHTWIVQGIVVIEPGATLSIEPETQIELLEGSLIIVELGASLQLLEPRPDLTPYIIDENASEAN